ncbi:liprin-beta-2 isoform X3 [Onthophagus taurus]|uniref:liprin-beta-2 isoform X3 n=1 Tax=Onthophagus taurus TaxID=166361 RepID=UPI000C20E32B|nr:liprin-beta-1 isoform X3 [Onthophagus taurus]
MRDLKEIKSGSLVATAIAMLEKSNQRRESGAFGKTRGFPEGKDVDVRRKQRPDGPAKNIRQASQRRRSAGAAVKSKETPFKVDLPEDVFELAVKDFDLTALDVQRFASKRAFESVEDDEISDDEDEDSDDQDVVSSDSESNGGLETITEEDRVTTTTANSSFRSTEGGDSSLEDESTVKGHERWSGSLQDSTSDLSTSSSSDRQKLKDSSTRCDEFQWIQRESDKSSSPKMEEHLQGKPPISRSGSREKSQRKSQEREHPGSLGRRRHLQNRQERDQKSRSSHIIKSPPRFDDYQMCQSWCCNPHQENIYYDNFHKRHERMDPQRYGSSPMLMEQRYGERGSHPDIYGDCGRFRYDAPPMGCCSYHMAPPCCFFGDSRSYHWTPPPYINKPHEQDDRYRKLQSEKDNLQLQVQVLSEQIEAQSEKITDLEKSLQEKKQQLISTEDVLQREMLSRSSLETQKLELMSAMSELKLQHAELERELVQLRSTQYNNNSTVDLNKKYPRASPQPQQTSTPIHHSSHQNLRTSPSPSQLSSSLSSSPRKTDSSSQQDVQQPPKTPPSNYRRQIDLQYSSLPRQQFLSNGGALGVVDSNANPTDGARKGVAFGRGFSSLLGGRSRGHSVPNLAETEKIVIEDLGDNPQSPSLQFNKNKTGIKKIIGKLKRSGSGNLEDLPGLGEFQRGGVRATAAARLGWSEPQASQKPDKPFEDWDADEVCTWLQDLGLDQYQPDAKRWIKSGKQLQEASINEIEKELAIKNPLHKKKLQLAIIDNQANGSSDSLLNKAGKLDTAWVLRWLDDTGLPQYKESFLINRIDGRVLHRLTMDDLALLHITSLLHVASLKRGIQVLRENNYEAGCLQRRSLPDDPEQPNSKSIALWTTHRVMEWLKAVDLAEYAPNLRGSGVHGGLMVLENKFTAELLATLLSIPPGKTLLRRHLNTHFKELLGKDVIQGKREAEGTLGYIPLTPSSKVKVTKKSHFSLKRNKSKSEADYGDLVCPMSSGFQSGDHSGSSFNISLGIYSFNSFSCCPTDLGTRNFNH